MEHKGPRSDSNGTRPLGESGPGIPPKVAQSAAEAGDAAKDVGADLKVLREDLKHLRETVAKLMVDLRSEAGRRAREYGASVVDDVSDKAADIAERGAAAAGTATAQAKSLAAELEGITRRNPLGALAGAVCIGVVIGMLRRRR